MDNPLVPIFLMFTSALVVGLVASRKFLDVFRWSVFGAALPGLALIAVVITPANEDPDDDYA